uniref:Putative tick transposon n=1 Tax=Ixodes ricinus TaxID=34613 RepID=A0A6B0UCP1_IXORI
MWKAVVVPGLTFANAVVCVPGDTRTALERSQREVGRQALGCHGTVANEAVQGDLGWSSFEAREATSKVSYEGRLRLMDRCRWAKRLFASYTHT